MPETKVTILGCGTSGGVPRIGNVWGDCDPEEPRNRRRRASILVQSGDTNVIIDTSPDFRMQCLDAGLQHLDGVLYTHDHADHTHGIDDLRGFMVRGGKRVPVWADKQTLEVLKQRFSYIFRSRDNYPAIAEGHIIDGPVQIGRLTFLPFEQYHGGINTLGFRFGDIAYSTDLVGLPDASFEALRGLELWIVDALRPHPHPTHAHLELTLSWIAELKPRRAVITHMTHEMDYQTLCESLPEGVVPAYDGMVLTASPI